MDEVAPSPPAETFQFVPGVEGVLDLSSTPKLALLAVSIARQQDAGFGRRLDLREFRCPICKAPGFNSGWGFVAFTCGAEIVGGEERAEPCGDEHG